MLYLKRSNDYKRSYSETCRNVLKYVSTVPQAFYKRRRIQIDGLPKGISADDVHKFLICNYHYLDIYSAEDGKVTNQIAIFTLFPHPPENLSSVYIW